VRFQKADAHLDYTFSVQWSEGIGVLNCDQREFFFDTHDDPATKFLLKAIDLFDESGRRKTGSLILKSVSAVQGAKVSYKVVVQSNDKEFEFAFSMDDQNSLRLVSDSHHSEIGDLDCIKPMIFNFHNARQLN